MNKEFQAFTTHFSGKVSQLTNVVGIALPNDSLQKRATHSFQAIWDTGATNCTITEKVIKALNLQPFSMGKVSGVHGEKIVNIYYIDVFLPNRVCIEKIRAFECQELVGGADVLIGMDIIGYGDFSVTHADGKTLMSFRIPSIKDIDYVEEIKQINLKKAKHTSLSREKIKSKRKKEKKNKKKS